MATYAIGDVQGCYDSLIDLLNKIQFDLAKDYLWFVGDLVNRGPRSLEVLRLIKNLGHRAITVLGNHDLHLLSVAKLDEPVNKLDTFDSILQAPDREDLLAWLRQQSLLHYDAKLGFVLVHAGLFPQWSLAKAQQCAAEVENILRSQRYVDFLTNMYGIFPNCWSENLSGWERLRFITNAFTRMRFCDTNGCLDLAYQGPIGSQPQTLMPWFQVPHRALNHVNIVFGHWAALVENWASLSEPHIFPLDSGCVWGGRLTALRLEDKQYFDVPSHEKKA